MKSFSRPITASIARALTDAPLAFTASAVTFDPATKQADVTLSNGNLTASTTQYANFANAISNKSFTDKRAIEFTMVYPGAATDTELFVGIAFAGWTPANGATYLGDPGGNSIGFDATGHVKTTTYTDVGLPVASGGKARAFIDCASGKGWFDNESNATASDREAGTNPHFTFTPGTAFFAACCMYSNTPPAPVITTINPTYSSGTFAACDA